MPISITEAIYLHIQCPNCEEGILKPVAWLASKSNMTCKGCSAVIDLKSPDNKLLIKETADHCERLEAVLKTRHDVSA
jgi:hypothetical protein